MKAKEEEGKRVKHVVTERNLWEVTKKMQPK